MAEAGPWHTDFRLGIIPFLHLLLMLLMASSWKARGSRRQVRNYSFSSSFAFFYLLLMAGQMQAKGIQTSGKELLHLLLIRLLLPVAHGGADAGPGDPDFR